MHVRLDARRSPSTSSRPAIATSRTGCRRAWSRSACSSASSAPGEEARLLDEIAADIAKGADMPAASATSISRPTRPASCTAGTRHQRAARDGPGARRRAASLRGGRCARGTRLVPDPSAIPGSARSAGRGRIPTRAISSRRASPGAFALRIRLLGFAEPHLASSLTLDVDGRETPFAFETAARRNDGARRRDRSTGPCRRRHRRGLPPAPVRRLWSDPRHKRAGLALAGVEVVPLLDAAAAHHAYGMRSRAACESQGRSSASGCS